MNTPVYIGMSVLDISKTLMYKFWYDYIKPKYDDRSKLYYTDTDSFVIHIITEDIYIDIADDVTKWFDTSNYDENDKMPLPTGFFKDKLGGGIMKEFAALTAKTYAYLANDEDEEKKPKGTKSA